MKNKYRVVVLGGYLGKVAERYFDTKPKMIKYVSTVIEYASEVNIISLEEEKRRWGNVGVVQEGYSKVDWA